MKSVSAVNKLILLLHEGKMSSLKTNLIPADLRSHDLFTLPLWLQNIFICIRDRIVHGKQTNKNPFRPLNLVWGMHVSSTKTNTPVKTFACLLVEFNGQVCLANPLSTLSLSLVSRWNDAYKNAMN